MSRATSRLKRCSAAPLSSKYLGCYCDDDLVALCASKLGRENITLPVARSTRLTCMRHVDLQAAGAAGGLIDQGGIGDVIDHRAAQDSVGLCGIVHDLVMCAGDELVADGLREDDRSACSAW